jgi:hypothetical protein
MIEISVSSALEIMQEEVVMHYFKVPSHTWLDVKFQSTYYGWIMLRDNILYAASLLSLPSSLVANYTYCLV